VTSRDRHSTSGTWVFLALAAALIAAGAYLFVPRGGRPNDAAADRNGPAIESLAENGVLPREGGVLRWTAIAGATYSVSVMDEQGNVLANARNLRQPEYGVPSSALTAIAPHSLIVWRVGAELADRRRITSKEFRTEVR